MTFEEQLKEFANGHWQLERPTEPGEYPVAGRKCAGYQWISIYMHEGKAVPTISWGDWWWSKPFPRMPNAPDAYEE